MIFFNSISILLLGLGFNLKNYMDLLLIWGSSIPKHNSPYGGEGCYPFDLFNSNFQRGKANCVQRTPGSLFTLSWCNQCSYGDPIHTQLSLPLLNTAKAHTLHFLTYPLDLSPPLSLFILSTQALHFHTFLLLIASSPYSVKLRVFPENGGRKQDQLWRDGEQKQGSEGGDRWEVEALWLGFEGGGLGSDSCCSCSLGGW